MADDAGPLLSRAGLIGDEQLLIARQAQSGQGGTIGEHLVLAGLVDDEDLTAFFQRRLMLPRVNPNDLARISGSTIAALPADMAAEFRVVPVRIDSDKNLTIAMSDPSNTHAVDEIAFFTSLYVVRAVATQRQIAWCLAHYYGYVTPLGHTLMEPPPDSLAGKIEAERRAVVPPVEAVPVEISDRTRAALAASAAGAAEVDEEDEEDDDFDSPIIEISEWERSEPTSPTGPMRKLPAPPVQPPELAPRAGELSSDDADDQHAVDALPAVVVDNGVTDSQPLLLTRAKSANDAVPEPTEPLSDEPVLILDKPRKRRRSSKRTRLGMGVFASLPPGASPETMRHPDAAPSIEDAAAEAARVASALSKRPEKESRQLFQAVAGVRIVDDTGGVPDREINDNEDTKSHASTGKYNRINPDWSEIDDGWGPPGTTIPPGYLGAVSDNFDEPFDHGMIPLDIREPEETGVVALGGEPPQQPIDPSEAETKPLDHTERPSRPATPRPRINTPPPIPKTRAPSPVAELQRVLEDSSLQLVETLRQLDRAAGRDGVVDCLLEYMRTSHGRACFFLVKRGVLTTFRNRAPHMPVDNRDAVNLRLDEHSTFQDVVRTRLSYNGPVKDERSRAFLVAAVGQLPGEIIALPISVRDRVVGVLYADTPERHVFNEHAAVVARAGGQAFERILKAAKQR